MQSNLKQTNFLIDITVPKEVFQSFFRQYLPWINEDQYPRFINELTTQVMQIMHLPESEFLFNTINLPNYDFFMDVEGLINNAIAKANFTNLTKEYALFLLFEINEIKINYKLSNITDYLLAGSIGSTVLITFIQGIDNV